MLGDMLGEVLAEQEGEGFLELVESVRRAAKSARAEGFGLPAELEARLLALGDAEAAKLARAFGLFLALANMAEQHHRGRRRRDHLRAGSEPQRASLAETFARLVAAGVPPERLHKTVMDARIELVLTAHPTEATRRTLLMKYQRVAQLLSRLDRPDLLDLERQSALRALRGEITGLWLTEDIRRERPTPEKEARGALAVVERILWDAVPRYLRELDTRLLAHTSQGLPPEASPVRFGSWIGGDRDGNPNVTAHTTCRVLLLSRWMGLHLYLKDLDRLREELSMHAATPAVMEMADGAPEPYRAVLRRLRGRLAEALTATERELEAVPPRPQAPDPTAAAGGRPLAAADIELALRACYDSLQETGAGIIADGNLLDTLRRVACFGLHLLPLDIRQEAARHTEAVAWLIGDAYEVGDEEARQDILLDALDTDAEVLPDHQDAPADVREVLDTFRLLAHTDPEALGAYVVSMAARPSDVLAVAYLQHRAGVTAPLPVVPLFETPDDLRRAPEVMERLLAERRARRVMGDDVQVMIGYSDSAKQAGMLAAAWALYQAQEGLVDVFRQHGVRLTLFHGRGGTVGRGGGPAHQAIHALPPGAVQGRLRVTEQGEVIQARFGIPGVALRSLELYTTAVVETTLQAAPEPEPAWRHTMDRLAAVSQKTYEAVLRDPAFPAYFQAVTPIEELEGLKIGSRPARRGTGAADAGEKDQRTALGAPAGPESLRAIPWVFAWTQNRLLLPAWLGVDDALREAPPPDMTRWPFWRSTLDLLEMALAKADPDVFRHYHERLAPGPRASPLLSRLEAARTRVANAAGHADLLEENPVLARSIQVRNPYLDPMHLLQVALLLRVRGGDDGARDALLLTLSGIAAGMRNTG